MMFAEPMPFAEALAFAREKRALPTSLTSAELRALDAELRRRSIFSAQLGIADQVQLLGDLAAKIAGGITEGGEVAGRHSGTDRMISIPEAKAQLLENLRRLGYNPGADQGTIKDFTTDARLQLQVETNVMDTLGFGQWQSGQDETALDVNPALELVRTRPARMPRDWAGERWPAARAASTAEGSTDSIATGRMVALKNHPIWQALGDGAGGFTDTLGNPWAPFAFSSGMGLIAVPRAEAMDLGLLNETTRVPAMRRDLNAGLEVSAERFDEALQRQLSADPRLRLQGGMLRLRNRARRLRLLLNARQGGASRS